jgi:hypothetical protein
VGWQGGSGGNGRVVAAATVRWQHWQHKGRGGSAAAVVAVAAAAAVGSWAATEDMMFDNIHHLLTHSFGKLCRIIDFYVGNEYILINRRFSEY